MKYVMAILAPLIILSCGIIDLFFPQEYPQRYIEREVNILELVGTWETTPDSEKRIDDYFKSPYQSPWGLYSPWKRIILYDDHTCEFEVEFSWTSYDKNYRSFGTPSPCTWKIDTISGYSVEGDYIDVTGVRLGLYFTVSDLYFVEENGELILWNFIGGYDYSVSDFHEFKKVNK